MKPPPAMATVPWRMQGERLVGRIVRWQKQVLRQKEHYRSDRWMIYHHTHWMCIYIKKNTCVCLFTCMCIHWHGTSVCSIWYILYYLRALIYHHPTLKHPKKWGFWIHATAFLQSIMTCNSHRCPLASRCYQSYPKHVTWDFCSPKAVELCKWNLDLEVPSCQFHQKRRPADRQNKNRGDRKWKLVRWSGIFLGHHGGKEGSSVPKQTSSK